MSSDGDDRVRDLELENEALNEQIKLLVQTEQRLYRSQNEIDAQLDRIRSLARFALQSEDGEPIPSILSRALEILWKKFTLDWCGVIAFEPDHGLVVVSAPDEVEPHPAPLTVDDALRDWILARVEPWFADGLDVGGVAPAERLASALAPVSARACPRGGQTQLSCVPLRRVDERQGGWLVTVSFQRRISSLAEGALAEEHLPFLQLLANHVDHAIANAQLTEDLRERSAELANSLEKLERTQADLVRSQKMEAVGRLAGGVAHDFNNLLTVILGYAGAVGSSLPEGSPQHGNVQRVIEAAKRAAGITSQLLALGRRQVLRREAFDLSEQTARILELLRRLVGEDVLVEVVLDRSLPLVSVDRSHFEQVLLNLVVNARDAMPSGGTMRIETRPATTADAVRADTTFDPSRFAVVSVADTGVGMDSGTLTRIFEPFYTTKEQGKGTGLGLAVVYGAVKQGEGHVLVESEPGRGSRFTVLLPHASEAELAAVAQRNAPPTVPPAAPGRVILVVEDEQAIRHVVLQLLRHAGYRVEESEHGVAALERLESGLVADLVLTDVMMPRMGGVLLAEEIEKRWPGMRVAFMSGYSEDLVSTGVRSTRRMAFLAKPFTPDVLLRFVAEQLAHGARR
ncbi:MAG: response regulator [Candidatus Eisenbacteria bacterium]|uniref:histidine kinase n=1 Tax=Eiseniibacteriota bacterium TaxID=2212470 RepID=A0A933W9E0_UNCEI|nr:response regulator [Candidatus Eisenbacteria bacterium]